MFVSILFLQQFYLLPIYERKRTVPFQARRRGGRGLGKPLIKIPSSSSREPFRREFIPYQLHICHLGYRMRVLGLYIRS